MRRLYQAKVTLLVTILLAFYSHGVAGKKRLGNANRGENARRKLELTIVGENGNPPPEMLPLGVCFGDCDTVSFDAGCLFTRRVWLNRISLSFFLAGRRRELRLEFHPL